MIANRPSGRLRIIGGKWRSRQLLFPEADGLRPTPDRVRETLFNWLRDVIDGARCLDLFAGSGALGFEALSRGAASVVMVDRHPDVIRALQANAQLLDAAGASVVNADGLAFIDRPASAPYDIVFLDPPFALDAWRTCCERLERHGWLAPGGWIYLETPAATTPPLPENWELLRSRRAGQVGYHLARQRGSAAQ